MGLSLGLFFMPEFVLRPRRFRIALQGAFMLLTCSVVAWLLYLAIRPSLPIPKLESDPILDYHEEYGLLLKSDLRDARAVIPARPHPLPFRPLDPAYTDRITKRTSYTCSTNSERFRGVREYPPHPAVDTIRIAAIGDSITFGHGVADEETYPAILEARLGPGFEVINAGMPGHDSERTLRYLRNRVLRFRPRIVTVCTGVNELAFTPERSDERRLQLWLTEERYRREEQEFAANLEAIDRACIDVGARVVFLVPPANSFSPYPDASRFCRIVRQVARQRSIPWIDLEAEFLKIEEQDGLVLHHGDRSQTVRRYRGGRPEDLLSVWVSPTRQQYIADSLYDYLDAEQVGMTLSLDGSHPNAQGMALIAQLLETVILEIVDTFPASVPIESEP